MGIRLSSPGHAKAILALLALSLSILAHASMAKSKPTYIEFDPPDASSTTWAEINAENAVAGTYRGIDEEYHGFLRTSDGAFTPIDVPGAAGTFVQSLNDANTLAGNWIDASFDDHGFLRTADGAIVSFDVDGATQTLPYGVNNRGDVAGWYHIPGDVYAHGFVRAADGSIAVFDVSGASDTMPQSINTGGLAAGYARIDSVYHGFLRKPDGALATFGVKGARNTFVSCIDEAGNITGYYEDQSFYNRGYVRAPSGKITTFRASKPLLFTEPSGVVTIPNVQSGRSSSEVVGTAWRESDYHAFLRTSDGTIIRFHAPDAGDEPQQGTFATGVNAKGYISGLYVDASGIQHAYLRLP